MTPTFQTEGNSTVCIINNRNIFTLYNFATILVGKIHWFGGCSYPRRGQASSAEKKRLFAFLVNAAHMKILFNTE